MSNKIEISKCYLNIYCLFFILLDNMWYCWIPISTFILHNPLPQCHSDTYDSHSDTYDIFSLLLRTFGLRKLVEFGTLGLHKLLFMRCLF